MEIAWLEVSTQRHIDKMQETAKVNYVHYGKGSKKSKGKSRPSCSSGSGSGSSVNTGKPSKLSGKGRKVPLPTDICWRCGKGRHQKGHPCKAVEAVCGSCGTKGHYENVCMKKSTHLVNVPATSTNSEPVYFNEHGDPVHTNTHIIHVKETNWNKHLIQFPISTDFKKVENSQEKCPTVLLKADTSADINLMNSTTFDQIIGDRSILQLTSLRMEAYGNNTTVEVLGTFHAFLRWKVRIYGQLFYITNANTSPNLLSRDGCYTLGVLKSCYSVETSKNFQQIPMETTSETHTAYNWLRTMQDAWWFISTFVRWRNWWGEAVSFHSAVSLQGATSRHAFECTLMFLLELGSF